MSDPGQPVTTAQPTKKSLIATLAAKYEIEPDQFVAAVAQTVMPKDQQVSNAMVAAFLMVCNEHGLNPFTREIFAFPTKTGGIQAIVSVDGWVKLVTMHPAYSGMEFDMKINEQTGKPISCTCTIYRTDREKQIPITEYYDECYRNTEPWNKMPKRMMRHKALKEAARYTFGFAGIMDEDEGRDTINITDESTVMSRTTMTKTEALKEKIGAKKAQTLTLPAAPLVTPEPTPPIAPTLTAAAPEPPQTAPVPPSDFPPTTPEPAIENLFPEEPDPNRLLTEIERQGILSQLKGPRRSPSRAQISRSRRGSSL